MRFEVDKKYYIPQPGDKLVGYSLRGYQGYGWEILTIERPDTVAEKGKWEIDPTSPVDPIVGRPSRRWVPETQTRSVGNDWADRRENSRFGSMG